MKKAVQVEIISKYLVEARVDLQFSVKKASERDSLELVRID